LSKYNEESRIEEELAARGLWRGGEILGRFLKHHRDGKSRLAGSL
jgi:hypothetical protein